MTFQALQEYLDVVKWKDSEKIRADMCGRYARCRYCNRTEDFPCARAHNRLIEVQSSPVPDHIPDWLLPEPPVKEQFGEELASEDASDAAPPSEERETAPENPQKTDQAEQIASETEKAEPDDVPPSAQETLPAETESAGSRVSVPSDDGRPRPHVIVRGCKGDTRICTIGRKLTTVSDVVTEQ